MPSCLNWWKQIFTLVSFPEGTSYVISIFFSATRRFGRNGVGWTDGRNSRSFYVFVPFTNTTVEYIDIDCIWGCDCGLQLFFGKLAASGIINNAMRCVPCVPGNTLRCSHLIFAHNREPLWQHRSLSSVITLRVLVGWLKFHWTVHNDKQAKSK
jgi:hypothetical protein